MMLFVIILVYSYWIVGGTDTNLPDSYLQDDIFLNQSFPGPGDIPLLNRKVFKGERVSIKEHPYIASIRRLYSHYCTGAVLSNNVVISAAHPLYNVTISELGVVVGETYADRGTIKYTVILLVVHEEFDPYTLRADMALLVTFEDFTYRHSVKPIDLISPEFPLNNSRALVTGWGRCDITGKELCLPRTSIYYPDEIWDPMLRSVSFDVVLPNEYCTAYKHHGEIMDPGMMCVGQAREENILSACLGVPGAPLAINSQLAGILSWGFGCGYYSDIPLVYTSIQHYQTWIVNNMQILHRIKSNNLTTLFKPTRAHALSQWIKESRILKPLTVPQKHKQFSPTKLDIDLAKLSGVLFDIRDYLYNGIYRKAKKRIYQDYKIERATFLLLNTTNFTPQVSPFLHKDIQLHGE